MTDKTEPHAPRLETFAAADAAPPDGMPARVWDVLRHTVSLALIVNLSQIAAFLRERESEAQQLSEQHAKHGPDCAMSPLALGMAMGITQALAVIESMVTSSGANLPAATILAARQKGESVSAAQHPDSFHADPARLEKFLREFFAESAAHAEQDAPPIRPRSPRDGGTIH